MRDITKNLSVAARLLLRRLTQADAPEQGAASFTCDARALLEAPPPGLIAGFDIFHVPGDAPPWFDTGMDLTEGTDVTTVAIGRTFLSQMLDIRVAPPFQLWFRVGATGTVFRGTRRTNSFTAAQNGRLYLASYFPGEWADSTGTLATPASAYKGVRGAMTVLVILWQQSARDSLPHFAGAGGVRAMLADEIDRQDNASLPPDNWEYLWSLGPSEIFRTPAAPAPRRHIACCTHRDVGILQKRLSLPLTATTQLTWRWRVDQLPSLLREDTVPSHDYMSIAVEFENGQDLTYYWSAALPVGTIYRCPLPGWTHRETHMVLRTSTKDLGTWFDETRDLQADYARAIGTPPQQITGVWLIANSLFQRRQGLCEFADISILDGGVGVEIS